MELLGKCGLVIKVLIWFKLRWDLLCGFGSSWHLGLFTGSVFASRVLNVAVIDGRIAFLRQTFRRRSWRWWWDVAQRVIPERDLNAGDDESGRRISRLLGAGIGRHLGGLSRRARQHGQTAAHGSAQHRVGQLRRHGELWRTGLAALVAADYLDGLLQSAFYLRI